MLEEEALFVKEPEIRKRNLCSLAESKYRVEKVLLRLQKENVLADCLKQKDEQVDLPYNVVRSTPMKVSTRGLVTGTCLPHTTGVRRIHLPPPNWTKQDVAMKDAKKRPIKDPRKVTEITEPDSPLHMVKICKKTVCTSETNPDADIAEALCVKKQVCVPRPCGTMGVEKLMVKPIKDTGPTIAGLYDRYMVVHDKKTISKLIFDIFFRISRGSCRVSMQ